MERTPNEQHEIERRDVLRAALGVAAAASLGAAALGQTPPAATGKRGDFDFLTGEWKIANRWLGPEGWLEFPGEATVRSLLEGAISVEELRIPARKFYGMGLRLLDPAKKLWADHWVNGASCVLAGEPSWGSFVDGVGRWDSREVNEGQGTIARGVWDEITPTSCRWYQASSTDGGKTWQESWVMRWTRA